MSNQHPTVVIIGAGFGGLWASKELSRAEVDVVLVDRHNYHTFFPLLYQVAAAELAPGDIAHPVRKIIRRMDNVRFTLANVHHVDTVHKRVATDRGDIAYDYLIVATGSTTRYFAVPGADQHSFPLRTLEHAVALRNHILRQFESAEYLTGTAQEAALTFVIVGGGPTGVEFSGALQELINGPLAKDHPNLRMADARVVLLEAGDRLLSIYPPRLSRYAARRLTRMGVEVRLGTAVAAVDPGGVDVGGSGHLAARTVVWTAGVGGPPELGDWGISTGSGGRATVEPELYVAAAPDVFVVGDPAQPDGTSSPMVAQNATQQGTVAARNIVRRIRGETLLRYRYRDLGNMAVIGRNSAVVHLFGRIAFKGYPTWVLWLGLHLVKLIGFRNRIAAVLSWSGDYLFRDRVARLITSDYPE